MANLHVLEDFVREAADEIIDACTECGRCAEVCPVVLQLDA